MPLNFPNSPTANQIFTDSTTGNRYLWDSINNVWRWAPNTVSVVIQSLVPGSPSPGQLWWNTDVGRLYIYYSDADSSQWVEASPSSGSIDVSTLTSYVNVASDLAKIAFQTANVVFPAFNRANAAFDSANVAIPAFNRANAAFDSANVAIPAFNTANAISNIATAAYITTNTAFNTLNVSYATTNNVYLLANATFTAANGAVASAANAVAAVQSVLAGNISTSQGISDRAGDVRNLPISNKSSNYTLSLIDNGQVISTTAANGNVFVISGIFSPGNTVTVYNNTSANVTITQNSGVTLQWAGLSNTGNRILQQRGLATLVCVGPEIFILTGAGFLA